MALITCKECGNLVSDKAIACPRCGYPMNTPEEVQTKQSVSTKTEGSGDKCTSDNGISHNNANCSKPIGEAVCVDISCVENPGKMEYRGVHIPSGKQLFHNGPIWGTNNIGEFLAIVHALKILKEQGLNIPVYSDSTIALKWIEQKRCKTKLDSTEKSAQTLELIDNAEKWLRENQILNPVEFWQKKEWGKNPANFGSNCSKPIGEALCVDAACSGNPGKMEYRGVHIPSGKQVFHYGPVWGTNNIGEFLAIVHGLALLKQRGSNIPIYSDSYVARKWIEQKKCKTKLDSTEKSAQTLELVQRAEKWLRENQYSNPIEVWQTRDWGEIPADFGRK